MAVWGKVLGAFFGYLFGGPFGLLLGLFLGHKLDKARFNIISGSRFSRNSQYINQQSYFYATFAVMGHVAKAKGKVTENEIRLATILMDKMALQSEARKQAQQAFRDGKKSSFPLEDTLEEIRQICGDRFDLLQLFLELQIQAAFADGHLEQVERKVLNKIAHHLGFTPFQLEQCIAMQEAAFHFSQQNTSGDQQQWQSGFSASRLQDAYKILGVDSQASSQEIKRAHRKLMNEHHPDKLAARGLPSEMMEVAKQKTQEIQSAYDVIKKEKGFK